MRPSIALLGALASSVYAENFFTYFSLGGNERDPGT
jgi:hypothetical protein